MLEESGADSALDADDAGERGDPARILAEREEFRETARNIRLLSVKDRDTLLLYAWEGLSYDEIALALAVPVGTVRSRLNRARRALRVTPAPEEGSHERLQYTQNLA